MKDRVAASVLVVDDDPEILHLMVQVLSRDFAVQAASSGEEALQILRRERVHAVVTDHMLPAITGIELLRQVAVLQPEAARVLITASTRMDTAQEAINVARVRKFLAKPFRAAELVSTVGEAVHEAAVVQIKSELVRELKERNSELSRAMSVLEQRDKNLSKKLEGLAFRDGVTGLFTHRYFQEALTAALNHARVSRLPLSLVLFDVDGFRRWNQEYGYAEGDLLLRKCAGLFTGAEAASRYGADRFALLMTGTGPKDAKSWAEQVCAQAQRMGSVGDLAGAFTLRAGVTAFPEGGSLEQDLIRAMEQALAEARALGGNRVTTHPAPPG